MVRQTVLLADADVAGAERVRASLRSVGARVVLGARSQQRLAGLSLLESDASLTVPVGDAVDGEVVLTAASDAFGPLSAVVLMVGQAEGRVKARVLPVSDAMALAEGLCVAAHARELPVVICGPAAEAVAAFVRLQLPAEAVLRVSADPAGVAEALAAEPSPPVRRRDRVRGVAMRLAGRVWPGDGA